MKQLGVFLLLCALLIRPGVSFGLEEVLFGPEFTMMDIENLSVIRLHSVTRRMHDHLIGNQPEGAKFTFIPEAHAPAQGTLVSPNGWDFHYHVEDRVLEIRMRPSTLIDFQKYASDMQDAIFVSGANEGVFPAMFRGGGHINVSSKSFLSNPLLYRNFIVDLFNHSELFMGAFGYDTNNALPLQMATEDTISRVRELIQHFDQGVFASDPNTIPFSIALNKILIASYDAFWAPWHSGDSNRGKYFAVNFSHMDFSPAGRVEIRAVRPQASMDAWVRQIRLLQRRLEYLETIREPIPLKFNVEIESVSAAKHLLNPPVKAQDALEAFYSFVRESGESWSDHRDYLWPKWIMDGELDKFEQSDWFLSRERNTKHIMGSGLKRAVNVESCEGELVAEK